MTPKIKSKRLVSWLTIVALLGLVGIGLASCNHKKDKAIVSPSDIALKIGHIYPETGQLNYYNPTAAVASKLAEQDIKAAGGNVEVIVRDSGTTPEIASASVDRLLDDEVHVIMGAYSSNVSLGIIDKIIASNRIMISPASSTALFTDYDDNGLVFRTVRSNKFWAKLIADEIYNNGDRKVAIVFRDEPFGQEIASGVRDSLRSKDGVSVALYEGYNINNPKPDEIAKKVAATKPDAIFLASFNEGLSIFTSLFKEGIRYPATKIYASASASGTANRLGDAAYPSDPSAAAGVSFINPAPADASFQARLEKLDPNVILIPYSGSTYDAVVIVALAALIANSTDSVKMAKEINGVTRSGTKCTTYANCAELIKAGENIDYDGIAGPLEFADAGEPTIYSYAVVTLMADGNTSQAPKIITSTP